MNVKPLRLLSSFFFFLLLGLSLGMLFCAVLPYFLEIFFVPEAVSNSAVTFMAPAGSAKNSVPDLDLFLSSNPFKISPKKTSAPSQPPAPPAPQKPDTPPEHDTKLAGLVLRGTFPGIGAWCQVNTELKLILIGREFEGYKLVSVSYTAATFRRGNAAPVIKYIVYGPVLEASSPAPAPSPSPVTEKTPPAPAPAGNITAAAPDQEGTIPAEMVSSLMQNPFDELKRIRMRPNEKAGGLEVQWIQNDSLLKRLGVQRGDIIRSVNGIPFTNMGDIANSINSLMSSERFDVEVTRGGKNTSLRYAVK